MPPFLQLALYTCALSAASLRSRSVRARDDDDWLAGWLAGWSRVLRFDTLCVQGAHVPPRRRQLSGGLLNNIVDDLSHTLRNELD